VNAARPAVDARAGWTAGRRLLVAYLGKSGHTVRELARECGVASGSIGMLASGAQLVPSLRLALALERIVGIDVHWWGV
jgi:hypothetical protein